MSQAETQVVESEPIPIDLNDPQDVERWARKLGVHALELRAAAKVAGNTVQAIGEQLAKRSASGPSS